MAAFTDKSGEKLAIQISVSRSFREGSGVSYATSVPQDATLDDINEINDRIMAAIHRQEGWHRLSELNEALDTLAKQKAQLVFGLADLEKRHGDKAHVSNDVKQARDQQTDSILRNDILVKELKDEYDRLHEGLA